MSDDIERLRRGEHRIVHVPLPERIQPPRADAEAPSETADPDRPPWLAIAGTIVLAVVAGIPHLAAAAVAIMVALVAAPLSWSLHRISAGRRKRAFVALAGLNALVIAIAVAATLIWLRLGIVDWPL